MLQHQGCSTQRGVSGSSGHWQHLPELGTLKITRDGDPPQQPGPAAPGPRTNLHCLHPVLMPLLVVDHRAVLAGRPDPRTGVDHVLQGGRAWSGLGVPLSLCSHLRVLPEPPSTAAPSPLPPSQHRGILPLSHPSQVQKAAKGFPIPIPSPPLPWEGHFQGCRRRWGCPWDPQQPTTCPAGASWELCLKWKETAWKNRQ